MAHDRCGGMPVLSGLLGSKDASIVAHTELATQPFQDFHFRPGIAGAFRSRQQIEEARSSR